ncbi:MAG: nuclear transport factor 2 family protein [Actinomycetota bacterium]
MDDGPTLAHAFLESLTSKDRPAMVSLLAEDVDFRGLTPSREWRATAPDEVAEIVFGSWFEPQDHVQDVVDVETHAVAGRTAVRYRLRVESEGEPFVVEQQGFLTADAGRITRMSMVCSGFLPWNEAPIR